MARALPPPGFVLQRLIRPPEKLPLSVPSDKETDIVERPSVCGGHHALDDGAVTVHLDRLDDLRDARASPIATLMS